MRTWQISIHFNTSYTSLSHRYERFTVKYATRGFHMKLYYIDTSVLPKNRQLVFSIRNYIRDTSGIFSISSLMKISLTSFLCFSSSFFLFSKHLYLCNTKKKLHAGLKMWSLYSRGKKISLIRCDHSWNIFSTWR